MPYSETEIEERTGYSLKKLTQAEIIPLIFNCSRPFPLKILIFINKHKINCHIFCFFTIQRNIFQVNRDLSMTILFIVECQNVWMCNFLKTNPTLKDILLSFVFISNTVKNNLRAKSLHVSLCIQYGSEIAGLNDMEYFQVHAPLATLKIILTIFLFNLFPFDCTLAINMPALKPK